MGKIVDINEKREQKRIEEADREAENSDFIVTIFNALSIPMFLMLVYSGVRLIVKLEKHLIEIDDYRSGIGLITGILTFIIFANFIFRTTKWVRNASSRCYNFYNTVSIKLMTLWTLVIILFMYMPIIDSFLGR